MQTNVSKSILALNILLIAVEIFIFAGVDLSVRYIAAVYALVTLLLTPFTFAITPPHLKILRIALLISWGVIAHMIAYALFVISLA